MKEFLKAMNEFNLGDYFKKIGKKRAVFVVVNLLLVAGLVAGSSYFITLSKEKNNELSTKEEVLNSENLTLLREKKDLEKIQAEVQAMSATVEDKDLSVQILEVNKHIDKNLDVFQLKLKSHESGQLEQFNKGYVAPLFVELEGSFINIAQFIKNLNESSLPIHIQEAKLFLPDKEFQNLILEEKLLVELQINVFKDVMFIEKSKSEDTEFKSAPFGYFYKIDPTLDTEPTEIDKYQDILNDYLENQNGTESIGNEDIPATNGNDTPSFIEDDKEEQPVVTKPSKNEDTKNTTPKKNNGTKNKDDVLAEINNNGIDLNGVDKQEIRSSDN